MYQIKCDNGYEIRVIGKGEKGFCEVVNTTISEEPVFTGTYAECERWCTERAIKVMVGQ